ncbi:MAG: bile acid:sodium symporter family protein [Burkholderiales bacterium]|nr:bile acid:sodium symporter family protein [Burkholderiales bacterium]
MNAIWIVLPILTILMFDIGLSLKVQDFKLLIKGPQALLAGLVGQLVIIPSFAFALAWAFNLEGVFFIGVMLIACSPGGSSSNIFSKIANGNVALSVTLTAFSSVLTVFTIPIIMNAVTNFVDETTATYVHLPVGQLLTQNLVLMLLPIVVGLVIRWKWSKLALQIDKILSKVAFPALMFLAVIYFLQYRQEFIDNFGTLGSCLTILILLAMGAGWLLSRCLWLNHKDEKTILIEVGMQNAAQAIAAAGSPFVFNNNVIAIPAIIYALVMNVVLLIYVAIVRNQK